MSKPLISYAQNHEDMILAVLLRDVKKGFYVDVGANHAVLHSVTKHFYDKGWQGINIEPDVLLHKELKKARPRDINLNVGVSEKSGKLLFRRYLYHDGFSTFSKEIMDLREKQGIPYEDIEVPVLPLKEIFAANKVQKIDFMKVDVEGYEYEVIKSNDWNRYKPKVLVVEGLSQKWPALIKKYGYTKVHYDGLNQYFVHKSAPSQDMNNYPDVLLTYGYVSANEYALSKEIENLKAERIKAEDVIANPNLYIGLRSLSKAILKRLIKIRAR